MNDRKRLPARFFESDAGRIPVRDWLLELGPEDRKAVGDDIRTAEFGWPIGIDSLPVQQGLVGDTHDPSWRPDRPRLFLRP